MPYQNYPCSPLAAPLRCLRSSESSSVEDMPGREGNEADLADFMPGREGNEADLASVDLGR